MPPSDAAGARYRLSAHASDESTRIEILDGNFRPIPLEQNLGDVSLELPAGVYAVRFHQGGSFTERLTALMPGTENVAVSLDRENQPEFAAAAPVEQTTTTHEWQREPARDLSLAPPLPPPPGHAGGSHLVLFVRDPFQAGPPPRDVALHDLGGERLFALTNGGPGDLQAQWRGLHANLDPGPYRLRRATWRGGFVEQVVFTQWEWQTQIFMMTVEHSDGPKEIARTSILMARPGDGFDWRREDMRWTESSLRALESRGNIPGAMRSEMLWAKFNNPMLGIYGGLLHLRRRDIDAGLVREVFANLFRLVGPLPDVLAIGWALALRHEATRHDAAFMTRLRDPGLGVPPMLRESWQHLLRANATEPDLIPAGSLADRIGARLVGGSPWLAWLGELPASQPLPVFIDAAGVPAPASPLTPPSYSTGAILSDSEPTLFARVGQSVGGLFEGAQQFTLPWGLPRLAELLIRHSDARFWLQTARFSDVERRVAYWLAPTLDSRLAGLETDPQIERQPMAAARARAADVPALLTELNVSAATAFRAAWSVFTKLFIQPVLPDKGRLDRFVTQESRGHAPFARLLRHLGRTPARLRHPSSGRPVTLLAFAYLYYRGSPAEGLGVGASSNRLAARLEEAGFIVENQPRSPTAVDLTLQHAELQQLAIRVLDRAVRRGTVRFPEMWQQRVFPPLERYSPGTLLPPIDGESLENPAAPAEPPAPPASSAEPGPRPLPYS